MKLPEQLHALGKQIEEFQKYHLVAPTIINESRKLWIADENNELLDNISALKDFKSLRDGLVGIDFKNNAFISVDGLDIPSKTHDFGACDYSVTVELTANEHTLSFSMDVENLDGDGRTVSGISDIKLNNICLEDLFIDACINSDENKLIDDTSEFISEWMSDLIYKGMTDLSYKINTSISPSLMLQLANELK